MDTFNIHIPTQSAHQPNPVIGGSGVFDDAQTLGQAFGVLLYVTCAIALAVVCFTHFGVLGALFAFVVGVFLVGLLAVPLIAVAAMVFGFLSAAVLAIAERHKPK